MDLRHQRYFIAVAEELHFGRAAASLGISQPALSKQIGDLEEELGVPLLWRKDGVRLTPAGSAFLRRAREVLNQVEHSVREAQSIGRGDLGSIELGFMSSASPRLLPTVVRAFRKRHPRVEVRLRMLVPPLHLDLLRKEQIDFALVLDSQTTPDLASEKTMVDPFMVALPVGHPLAWRPKIPARALNGIPFVFYPRHIAPDLFDEMTAFMRSAGAVPNVVLEAFPVPAMLSAVAAGIGVTLLPDSMRDIRQKGVVYRSLSGPRLSVNWVVAYRKGPLVAAQVAFLEVLRSLYPRKKH